jgi:hypothetical protein
MSTAAVPALERSKPRQNFVRSEGLISKYAEEEYCRLIEIEAETCPDDTIGEWIEELGYEVLCEALSDGEVLSVVYPDLKQLFEQRHVGVREVEQHISQCRRCQLVSENHQWAEEILSGLFACIKTSWC